MIIISNWFFSLTNHFNNLKTLWRGVIITYRVQDRKWVKKVCKNYGWMFHVNLIYNIFPTQDTYDPEDSSTPCWFHTKTHEQYKIPVPILPYPSYPIPTARRWTLCQYLLPEASVWHCQISWLAYQRTGKLIFTFATTIQELSRYETFANC